MQRQTTYWFSEPQAILRAHIVQQRLSLYHATEIDFQPIWRQWRSFKTKICPGKKTNSTENIMKGSSLVQHLFLSAAVHAQGKLA